MRLWLRRKAEQQLQTKASVLDRNVCLTLIFFHHSLNIGQADSGGRIVRILCLTGILNTKKKKIAFLGCGEGEAPLAGREQFVGFNGIIYGIGQENAPVDITDRIGIGKCQFTDDRNVSLPGQCQLASQQGIHDSISGIHRS